MSSLSCPSQNLQMAYRITCLNKEMELRERTPAMTGGGNTLSQVATREAEFWLGSIIEDIIENTIINPEYNQVLGISLHVRAVFLRWRSSLPHQFTKPLSIQLLLKATSFIKRLRSSKTVKKKSDKERKRKTYRQYDAEHSQWPNLWSRCFLAVQAEGFGAYKEPIKTKIYMTYKYIIE